MKCQLDISEILIVRNAENPQQALHLDISRFYCRLFETTRDQCHDYLEEIMRWADGQVENYEYISENLFHFTAARRRFYGLKR